MTQRICAAERVCEAKEWRFEDAFPFQFRISKNHKSPCDGWQNFRIDGWHLHHCPRLPRHDLVTDKGRVLGVVLGVAVDAQGVGLDGTVTFGGDDSAAQVEAYIEGLAGRFIAIASIGDTSRLYLDPTGGLSVVYSMKDDVVASSVFVLINRDIDPEPGISSDAVLAREGQYHLGETCDRHCRRLYANHYLVLDGFKAVRHWPRPNHDYEAEGQRRNQVAVNIAKRLSDIIAALVAQYSCALPLSGGMDSRIMLAAAKPVLSGIDHFYMHDIYKVTRFDRIGAQNLATEMGLKLEVIDSKSPEFSNFMSSEEVAELRAKMTYRTGLGFDGIDEPTVRAVSMTPDSTLILRGNAAEMTRANKWTGATASGRPTLDDGLAALLNLRAEQLAERVEPKRLASLRERYAQWYATLPEPAKCRMPDLAHAEVFMPAAPNNAYYAFGRNFYINPYNDRGLLFLTAAFHPLARRRHKLVPKIINQLAPELNGLPYMADIKKQFRAKR